MRNHGRRFELIPMRPHDHIGWVFSGLAEFAVLARSFLEDGASRGERLMLVAEDPDAELIVDAARGLDPSDLELRSISDVYGTSGVVDVGKAYSTYARGTDEAVESGYRGLRVAADNSPLVETSKGLEAWISWELLADRFMVDHKLTALCAFDRERVRVDTLRHLATLHPMSSAAEPVPQFSLFADEGKLCIEGEIDAFAVDYLRRALEILPPKTSVVIDLTRANLRGNSPRAGLRSLAERGVEVTFTGMADSG